MKVIRLNDHQRPVRETSSAIAGFDALKAMAAVAVVTLHAGVPYLRHPMPGLIWPVMDSSSRLVDAIFWSIEVVVMPLFLMIAGFLLWRSSRRLSPGRLVKSRAERLLVPLAFGALIVLPIDLFVWTLGLVAEGTVPAIKLKSYKFSPPISDQIWGLAHLWFLLYVFLYVVVAACLFRLGSGGFLSRAATAFSRPTRLAVILAVVAVVSLTIAPEIVWGFQHAFLPVPSKWIYSGMFFAAGCVLAVYDGELRWACKETPRLLGASAILLPSSVLLGIWMLEQSAGEQPIKFSANLALALLTVAAAGTCTLGLIGAAKRYIVCLSKPVRYLASVSFWIYIVHHPLLGVVHYDLKWLWPQGPPIMKLAVSLAATIGLSLLMFEGMVRRTWIGVMLGYSKPSTPEPTGKESELIALPNTDPPQRRAA